MAAFLLGRGSFQWDNGTTYHDVEFRRTLEMKANAHQGRYHRLYNVVRDSLGNKLLELSIPAYKRWKTTLAPGELVYLSSTTALRGKDVEDLERILLEDPDFVDVQVQGFRVNRRFFEVANSY